MFTVKPLPVLLGLAVFLLFARPAHAFGAGNIAAVSSVEGQNWRHGDLEDTLLTLVMARVAGGKKFSKLDVSRTYFGNWLRDYSQAIDVGTVKSVSAEAIRLLLSVLGFLTFGYGSREFEVTAERLGCYRPEDHIDNPKNYADNEDATQYFDKLRSPVNESVELAVDEETGMKNYIANDRVDIMTSSKHVRTLFTKCIELAHNYKNSRNKADLHEALRLLGTGLHCLEDFLAHSNYTELALIELGERDIFPHVGRDTRMRLNGANDEVYPLVTGTFGGVDFLHSVTGEMSDKMVQSEIEDLEGTLQKNSRNDTSVIEGLLDKIPDGLLGGGGTDDKKQKMHEIENNANSTQMEQARISPRETEEFTKQVQDVFRQIMPAIEFHDELFMNISEAFDKIPILPQIIEQLEEQMSLWVFSIMAPLVVPILQQIKSELRTGSSEIIQSSQNEQHIVFNDDSCTDPTHSMLSKDHFTNILNEPAGKTAAKIVEWVVPQLMEAWDDENADVNGLLDRIVNGVLHHPAQRGEGRGGAEDGRSIMFRSVQEWWEGMSDDARDEYRRKLSREGVERGENHREGQHDTGHGCCQPLQMHKNFAKGGTFEDRVAAAAAGAIVEGVSGGLSNFVNQASGGQVKLPGYKSKSGGMDSVFSGGGGGGGEESSSGGGGGFLGQLAGSLLGGAFGGDEKETRTSRHEDNDGSVTETRQEYGQSGNTYAQAQYSQTHYSGGGESSEYRSSEVHTSGGGGGGGYESRTESQYQSSSSGYQQSSSYGGGGRRDEEEDNSYGSGRRNDDNENSYGGRSEEHSYGGGGGGRRHNDDEDNSNSYGGRHGGGGESDSYRGSGGGRQEYGGNNDNESSSYGGGGSRQEYGRGGDDNESSSYGGGGGSRQEYGQRRNDDEEENSYSSRRY
ncbi:Heterokaryon incompatibility protein Het-C [Microdochium nivale]|nr:Heterokaryon incompatibility protein Het-C [Microdochium nivale]